MRPPAHSRVDDVIVALIAAIGTIDGVTVLDGRLPSTGSQRDTLVIAQGRNAVQVRRDRAPGLGDGYIETMRIVCRVHSFSGSIEPSLRRPVVTAVMDAVEDALQADRKLGGVCDEAYLGRDEFWDQDTGDVAAEFTVQTRTNT